MRIGSVNLEVLLEIIKTKLHFIGTLIDGAQLIQLFYLLEEMFFAVLFLGDIEIGEEYFLEVVSGLVSTTIFR